MSQYENWIYQQENPDENIYRGNYKRIKQDVPCWVAKNRALDKMKEEMGEEEYRRRVKEDEVRQQQEFYY